MFVLKTLESCTHSLIQSANPSLLLVEDPKNKNVLDNFYLAFILQLFFTQRVYESEIDGMMTQFSKRCIKDYKQSFLFNERLFKGKRKSRFHYQTLIWNVLNQFCSQSNVMQC
jgi:hypothetical protein